MAHSKKIKAKSALKSSPKKSNSAIAKPASKSGAKPGKMSAQAAGKSKPMAKNSAKGAAMKASAAMKGTSKAKKASAKKTAQPVAKLLKTASAGRGKVHPISMKSKSMGKTGAKTKSSSSPAKKAASQAAGKVIALRPKASSVAMQNLFSPLDDRVLVERMGVSDRTPGGLFIPEMVKERPNEGFVLAVGRGLRDKKGRLRPLDVKVGDRVMFMKWAGAECSINSKELVILHESDIYGVV